MSIVPECDAFREAWRRHPTALDPFLPPTVPAEEHAPMRATRPVPGDTPGYRATATHHRGEEGRLGYETARHEGIGKLRRAVEMAETIHG